jgi:Protein of unknown function (DUF808)
MSVGLIALLDDTAAIAKVAAASLDDVASQAAKAGVKVPNGRATKRGPHRPFLYGGRNWPWRCENRRHFPGPIVFAFGS